MPASAEPAGARPATPADWQQVFVLLDAVLDLPADDRPAWLAAQDPRLAPMVEALLRDEAALGTGGFLSRPLDAGRLVGPDAPSLPAQVGPYRLLRQIGEGGMASVWLAERADGLLDRRVALKLPHVGRGGLGGFAERLARERNILGNLAHPHIARLYDAGIADDGRPYLALEHIEGAPIDAHAEAAALDPRPRVELLLQVARAVAHAHAQLVVHRDLKPSNILVDTGGRAKLLDFGIAKLLDAADGRSADTLLFGQALTPDYASPEQIRGEAIGTGSDIYSLGVVAFELLVGVRPYRLGPGGAVQWAEALARLTVPRASSVAVDAGRQRALRGDLDAILAQCLAPTPAERYPTMAALADDFERHLRGEPVRARPAHAGYLVGRWLRRHRFPTAAGAAIAVALAGGRHAELLVLCALAAGAGAALWQRNLARRQARIALAALARGEEVKAFIASIFTHAVPRQGAGGPVAAADLLRAASRRVETDLARQPAVQAELAALIGGSFNELGEMRASLDWLPKAVAFCRHEFGPRHPTTLHCRWRWIEAANSAGALAVSEPLLAPLVGDVRAARPLPTALLAQVLQSQAFVATKQGRETEALAALDEAVAVATAAFGEASDPACLARSALSNTLVHFQRPRAALDAIAPSLTPVRAAHGGRRPHPLLAAVERNHGNALTHAGQPRQAATLLRQVLADQRALDAGESLRVRVDTTLYATALLFGGHLDEAHRLFADAAALLERLGGGGTSHEAAQLQDWLALASLLRGDADAALAHAEIATRAMQGRDEAAARSHRRAATQWMARLARGGDDAAAALADTDALLRGEGPLDATARVRLRRHRALALRRAGHADAAFAAAGEALAALDAGADAVPALEHGLLLAEQARAAAALGDPAAADRLCGEALAVWQAGEVDGTEVVEPLEAERGRLALRSA